LNGRQMGEPIVRMDKLQKERINHPDLDLGASP
jgi:hypothetical protein